jgi:hypothetical protein
MKIDDIKAMWAEDSEIGHDLSAESLRIFALHSKWLSILMDLKASLKNAEMRLYDVQRKKVRFYKGEMSLDELESNGWKQYQGAKPLRADLEDLIKTDPDVVKVQNRVDYVQIQVDAANEIMKSISGRQWVIRNAIDFQKFQAGV